MKKLVSLLLALLLVLGCAVAEVNTEGYEPIWLGDSPVVITCAAGSERWTENSNPAEMYFFKYAENYLNVKFDVQYYSGDRLNMLYASNELPDLLLGRGGSPTQTIMYGATTHQYTDMAPYLTEELTPNILDFFEKYPDSRAACTCIDGGIYTLPFLQLRYEDDLSASPNFSYVRTFINTAWLEDMDLEYPETLDDLLEILRAFKTRGDNVVPLSALTSIRYMLWLNFAGSEGFYSQSGPWKPGVTKDGEVVYGVEHESYVHYLEFLHTCYEEGLVSKDICTMSNAEAQALVTEDKAGVYIDWAPYNAVSDTWNLWDFCGPLVYEAGQEKAIVRNNVYSIGGVAISAKCEYPEVVMRVLDMLFTPEGQMRYFFGPASTEGDKLLGYKGWTVDESGILHLKEYLDGDFGSDYEFQINMMGGDETIGCQIGVYNAIREKLGLEPVNFEWDLTDPDVFYRYTMANHTYDYLVNGYPKYVYMSSEDSQELNDIEYAIADVVKAEEAKFITGARSLDEYDAYIEELKAMGLDRATELAAAAYENYK